MSEAVVGRVEFHGFSPPLQDAATLHLSAEVFDGVQFKQTGSQRLIMLSAILSSYL